MAESPFHPDLRRVARLAPKVAVGRRNLWLHRAVFSLIERLPAKGVEVARVGELTVRLHRPDAPGPLPALLWIHGGGLVFGNAAQDDRVCRDIADQAGCVVAAVDYRLAPEHPFPAPLDDCFDALSWLARLDGIDGDRIAIGGGSAGGGLAAALALMVRDRGPVRPALQLLVQPMLDDRTAARADPDAAHRRLWSNRANAFGWSSYLGVAPGGPDVGGLAAPARAEDLTGLPPAWIGVGTLDLFHDEDVAYAHRLRAAGVPCELVVIEGAFHGFEGLAPKSVVARAFRAAQVRMLVEAFGSRRDPGRRRS